MSSSSLYKEYEVFISSKQKNKLQAALKAKKTKLTIKVQRDSAGAGGVGDKALLLLTKSQIAHIEGAARDVKKKKDVTIRMSKRQLRANTTFEGGFLSILAGLAARVLPTLLTGLASGLVSGLIERAVTKKKKRGGDGIYIRKGKHCYRANPVKGDGLFLSRHHGGGHGGGGVPTSLGDGLFLRHGRNVYDGKGLILGRNSPFKNIPILGWLL